MIQKIKRATSQSYRVEKIIVLIIFVVFFKYANAEEFYYINSKSGLNVRSSPSLTSEKVARMPFGVVIEKVENTNEELVILDQGKKVKGRWVKIKYDNYGYLVNEETEQFQREGFVFDAFIKPMKNKNLEIQINKINEATFFDFKEELSFKSKKFKKIEDLDTIKSLLKNRVKWQRWGEEDSSEIEDGEEATVVKSIITENNQKIIFDTRSGDVGFSKGYSGYYPEEEILVLEGGHSSDISYSIKYGGEVQIIGNPEYIESSPKTDYRLNGYFSGQECSHYFLEKKENGVFTYYSEIELNICYFKSFYWIGKTQFIFSTEAYDNESKKTFDEYFKGEINNK